MHDIRYKKWNEFPFELSAKVKRIMKLAERVPRETLGQDTVSSWRDINMAALAVREHGMPRMEELMTALAACTSHEAVWEFNALDDVLARWTEDPEMAAPPIREPRVARRVQGLKMPRGRRLTERRPSVHAAPSEWWMAGHAWMGFRLHDLFWDAKTAVILDDPATHEMCGLLSGRGRLTYTVKYGDGLVMTLPDGTLRNHNLKSVPDGSFGPADVLLCSCQTFNIRGECFSSLASVHETLIRLNRIGLLGADTVKFGVGYVDNGEYVRDYLNVRDFLFRADVMLTEYVDDWEGYELERKMNEPRGVELL